MTILVDTSIWADHFRAAEPALTELVEQKRVVIHPFVIGELAMGNLRNRARAIAALDALPKTPLALSEAFFEFVGEKALGGTGLGFVDAHLLISASLCGAAIWTRDRRLDRHADALSLRWSR